MLKALLFCLLGLSMRSFWCCGRYKIPCHHSPLPPPSQRVKAALSSPSCQAVGTEMGIAAAVDGDAAAVTAVAFSSCHHSARALQDQAVTQQSSFSACYSLFLPAVPGPLCCCCCACCLQGSNPKKCREPKSLLSHLKCDHPSQAKYNNINTQKAAFLVFLLAPGFS